MNFKSDNTVPVNPEILEALIEANQGYQASYGSDEYSVALQKKLSEIFEKEIVVYLTNTGTAANSLALSALVQPYEVIFCAQDAHIYTDECGAPEFYTSGAKLLPLEMIDGKINIQTLDQQIQTLLSLRPHMQKPGCISLTQATESGTVYTIQEIKKISQLAKQYALPIHMDGARFANSLVHLGCTPAEMTWKAGVDVMSFGATKNGAMCAEAIIFFNSDYSNQFDYRHKRSGQLISKSRFFSSQFLAYFKNDLWLNNAKHANQMAQLLTEILKKNSIPVLYPVESNEVFVTLNATCAEHLRQKNYEFYSWGLPNSNIYRFVCSWYTVIEDIKKFSVLLSNFFDKRA